MDNGYWRSHTLRSKRRKWNGFEWQSVSWLPVCVCCKLQFILMLPMSSPAHHHHHHSPAEPTERKIPKNWTCVNTRHSSRKLKMVSDIYPKVSSQSFHVVYKVVRRFTWYQTVVRRFSSNYSRMRLRAGSIRFIYCVRKMTQMRTSTSSGISNTNFLHPLCCVVAPILLWPSTGITDSRNKCSKLVCLV